MEGVLKVIEKQAWGADDALGVNEVGIDTSDNKTRYKVGKTNGKWGQLPYRVLKSPIMGNYVRTINVNG